MILSHTHKHTHGLVYYSFVSGTSKVLRLHSTRIFIFTLNLKTTTEIIIIIVIKLIRVPSFFVQSYSMPRHKVESIS